MDDTALMQLALAEAEQSALSGEVPVGAVVQTEDGRLFPSGNAPIATHDATAHAEIRAIRAAGEATGNYRLTGATLAVTLEPCLMCCGAIIHARIARVVTGADDPKAGAVFSLYRTLSDARLNHRPAIVHGIEAARCGALLKDFFRQRRMNRT